MGLDDFLSSTFLNTTVTYGWVIRNLKENDKDFQSFSNHSPVQKINYEEIGAGEGYLSKVLRVDLACEKHSQPYSVVLKIPCLSDGIRKMMDNYDKDYEKSFWDRICSMHSMECRFYQTFSKNNLRLPRIYATEDIIPHVKDGAVLMQLLKDKASCTKRGAPFTEEQVLSLVKELAKLAAITITMKEEDLEMFVKSSENKSRIISIVLNAHKKAVSGQTEFFGTIIDRLIPLFTEDFLYYFDSINSDLGLKPILSHGDLWSNNIFWTLKENGEPGNNVYAIIDWQTAHVGSIADDLAKILVINTNASTRRKLEKHIFEIYHEMIETNLKEYGQNMQITVSQIEDCYRREFLKHLMTFPLYVDVLTAKKSDAEDTEETQQRDQSVRQRWKDAAEDGYEILKKYLPEWLPSDNSVMKENEPSAETS